MTARLMARVPTLFAVGLFLTVAAGCEQRDKSEASVDTEPEAELPVEQNIVPEGTRGIFGAESCDSTARVPVDANAVVALYFDADGQVLGTNAESLMGTTDNMMCPAPEASGPAACGAGTCPVLILGKTYCRKC